MLLVMKPAVRGHAVLGCLRVAGITLACLAILSTGAAAQFGVPIGQRDPRLEPVSVRELVSRYCRLDYAGARLKAADWPKLQPLVAWPANPDYSLFMATSRFDVDSEPVQDRGKYLVTVHYRVLGKYDMNEGYSLDTANVVEDVQFTVSEVNGDWKITDAEPGYPHPSRAAALEWLNQHLAGTQDPVAKTIYQHALELLQAQKSNPPAK